MQGIRVKRFLFGLAAFVAASLPVAAADLSPDAAAMIKPVAPFRISDDIYYVGASDVTSFLIVTDDGLILTDGGFDQMAPQIEANIKTLGFDIRNVKILLNSHAHYDHAGGLAALKAASGARFLASRGDAPVLESGGQADFADFARAHPYPPIKPDAYVEDGEKIALGHTVLTAHLTPGHTKGCSSWTMTTHVNGKPVDVLFICSLTVLPSYRLLSEPGYPEMASDFAASFKTLRALPCQIFIASHGVFFDLKGKRAKLAQQPPVNPFIDPEGCHKYIDAAEKHYDEELAKERTQAH
jgi:metallo-beta-lactamase class B